MRLGAGPGPLCRCVGGGVSGPAQPLLLALLGGETQAVPPACGGPRVPLVHVRMLTQPGVHKAKVSVPCSMYPPPPPTQGNQCALTLDPPIDGGRRGLCQDVPGALTSGRGSRGVHRPASPSQGPRVRWCWPRVPPGPAETAASVGSQRITRASPVPAPQAGRVSPGGRRTGVGVGSERLGGHGLAG